MSTQLDRIEGMLKTLTGNKPSAPETKQKLSKYGGVAVPYFTDYMKAQADTGDSVWINLYGKYKDYLIIINKDLQTKLQHETFHFCNNRAYPNASNRVKAYSNNHPPAAKLIFEAFTIDGKRIEKHLSSCANNDSWIKEGYDQWQSYIDNTPEALIRFINQEYTRLTNRDALELK